MKTKDRIVFSAIELFNLHGIHEISIRDIADQIGISSGNFAYHFKNKEALLEYFYDHMYDEVSIATELSEGEGFQEFQNILSEIIAFMNKYSFFYTDMVDIFRTCPNIKRDYARNYEGRKNIYKGILSHFIDRKLIGIPVGEEQVRVLDELTHTIWFTLTFWQSQKKILPKDSIEVQGDFIIKQIWRILMPYMTDVGLRSFHNIK